MEILESRRAGGMGYMFLLLLLGQIQGVTALSTYSRWYLWLGVGLVFVIFCIIAGCLRKKQLAQRRIESTQTVVVHSHAAPNHPPPHHPPHPPPPMPMHSHPGPSSDPAYPPGYGAPMGMHNAPVDPFQKASYG